MVENELTPEQETFCIELSVENNLTKAYMRAFPDSSYDSARSNVHRLIANESISNRVEELRAERAERLKLDGDKLLQTIYNGATANVRDMYKPDGSIIPIHEMHPDVAACIQSIEVEEIFGGAKGEQTLVGYVRKIKLIDRLKAADLVGRNLKLWKDVGSKDNPLEANIAEMGEIEKAARVAAILSKAKERKEKAP